MSDKFIEQEFDGKIYNARHGGPFDRGSADSWYDRPRNPHYFLKGSYSSQEIKIDGMTQDEIDAYHAGYTMNEIEGGKAGYEKGWG